jgi:methyl-accepting chemotaxis protein
MQGKMIIDVYQPDLAGKDLSNFKDPTGKKIFAELIKIAREKGEGYDEHQWPRYEGKLPVPHVAYVRLFPKWDSLYIARVPRDLIEGYEEADVILYVLQNQGPIPQNPPATTGQ